MSIKSKLIAALMVLVLTTTLSSAFIWIFAQDQKSQMADAGDRLIKVAAKTALLVTSVKDMHLHVVQVQQYFSDVSATRAEDGLDQGIRKAQYQANLFKQRLATAQLVSDELGLADIRTELDELGQRFDPFFATGQRMAEAYIKAGTKSGNAMMMQFDEAVDDMAVQIDTITWRSQINYTSKIDEVVAKVNATDKRARQLAFIVPGLAGLSLLIIGMIAVLLYGNVARPMAGMTAVMKKLAAGELDVDMPSVSRGDEIGDMAQALEVFKASQAAKATADRLRDVLNKMPIGVLVAQEDNTIDFANSYARTMFGSWGADARGRHISEFLPDLAGKENPELALIDLLDNQSFIRARRFDGKEFQSELQISPMDDDGKLMLWMIRDATRKIDAENRRQKLELDLRHAQKLESLGTLAGGIAHELNTPIQFVTDNMNFLTSAFRDQTNALGDYRADMPEAQASEIDQKYDLDFLREEAPQAIKQSLEGLGRISEIVLAIKRFSYPGEAEMKDNNLNEIIKTAATVSRNQWKYVADLDMDLDPNLPMVRSNAGELNQVFLNLIVNAGHAIEDKGDSGTRGRIKVVTRAVKGGVECSVSDTGSGIKPEIRDKIFDLFFTTKAPGRGTGQGLSVVHSIVTRNHRGKISLASEVGQGSTFTIMLPFLPAGDDAKAIA